MVLSGNHSLGAFFPSQWLAAVGSFVLHGPPLLPYGLRLDARWECDGIHRVQSRRRPFAAGEPAHCFPDPILMLVAVWGHAWRKVHSQLRGYS